MWRHIYPRGTVNSTRAETDTLYLHRYIVTEERFVLLMCLAHRRLTRLEGSHSLTTSGDHENEHIVDKKIAELYKKKQPFMSSCFELPSDVIVTEKVMS